MYEFTSLSKTSSAIPEHARGRNSPLTARSSPRLRRNPDKTTPRRTSLGPAGPEMHRSQGRLLVTGVPSSERHEQARTQRRTTAREARAGPRRSPRPPANRDAGRRRSDHVVAPVSGTLSPQSPPPPPSMQAVSLATRSASPTPSRRPPHQRCIRHASVAHTRRSTPLPPRRSLPPPPSSGTARTTSSRSSTTATSSTAPESSAGGSASASDATHSSCP